jgi:predicted metallo-beta-lactamase superfamily hydrolase
MCKILKTLVALENSNDNEDISRVWESIKENIKPSSTKNLDYYELKEYEPWFDEACSKTLDQRNQDKLEWLQNPKHNLKNVTHKTSRTFRNKQGNVRKTKLMTLK